MRPVTSRERCVVSPAMSGDLWRSIAGGRRPADPHRAATDGHQPQGRADDPPGGAARPGRHDHRRQRLCRLRRRRRVHRRRDRGDRRAQRRRHPGRRGHQPGRRRPRALRLEDVAAGAQAHGRGAGAAQGAHVDPWLFCPYHPDGIVQAFARASADRKPAPGMALAAAEALDLDLAASWVVGDSACDVGLARAVGARPLRIGGPGDRRDPDVDTVPGPRRRGRRHPRRARRAGIRASERRRSPRAVPRRRTLRRRTTPPSWPARMRTVDLAEVRGGRRDPRRGLRPRRGGLRLRQRRVGVHRQPPPVRPRQGRAHRHRPAHPGAEPEHQRRAAQRDRQRHRLRARLRVPAAVAGPPRRRAGRDLLVGPLAEHRPGAGVGRRARDADHRAHRLRRAARRASWPTSRSTSTRPTTASSRTPTRRACTCWPSTSGSRGCPTTTSRRRSSEPMRVAINLLTDDPRQPVRRALVLDPDHPRDGAACWPRTRSSTCWSARGPRRCTRATGPESATHLPVVQRAPARCGR